MGLESIVGGAAGSGLTALGLSTSYGNTALAVAALGVVYPLFVIGGAVVGAYLVNYLRK